MRFDFGSIVVFIAIAAGAGSAQAQVGPNRLIHTGARSPGTVTVSVTSRVYTLTFTGDETISYSIDTNDLAVRKGTIRVYESTSDSWPIRDGGVCFRNAAGSCLFQGSLAAYTTLTSKTTTADSVVFDFTLALEGVHHMRHTYQLTGKNLRIRVEDPDQNPAYLSNWTGVFQGSTYGTEEPKYLAIQGALGAPLVMFRKGTQHYFLADVLDMYSSNAATINFDRQPVAAGMTSARFTIDTYNQYKRMSNGQSSGPLEDTINVTVSSKIKDVLVTPSQAGSPYRDLLTGRVMINIPITSWTDQPAMWNLFQSWGMDDVAAYYFSWTNSVPDWTEGTVGPDWYPAKNPAAFTTAVQSGISKGYLVGANMSFALMPLTAPASVYDPAHVARTSGGGMKLGEGSNIPLISPTAAAIHAARESALVKTNYGVNMGYIDVQTYGNPSLGVDGDHVDQMAGSRWARNLREAIRDQQRWLGRMADTYNGPMAGEGSIGTAASSEEWLWAGYCDSVQRTINSDSGIDGGYNFAAGDPLAPTNWPVIPEYDVRVMSRVQANHGNGFPDRFFGKSDGAGIVNMTTGQPLWPLTEAALDKYRLYEITYAKMAYFQCNGPYNGAGNYLYYADMLKSYYLTAALQQRYFDGAASKIEYMNQGLLKSFESILFATETCDSFRHPQIKETYDNGLELYANHSTTPWTVTAGGATYTIPEDGFVAVQPGTPFVAFSAIPSTTGGARIDYCYAPNEYEMFDGRGVVNAYGNLDTGGVKRLKFKNFVHNVTGTETAAAAITLVNGTAPVCVHVDVLPAQVTLVAGERRGLRAIATFDNGSVRNVTSLVDWTSSTPSVATINEGAALTAKNVGATTIGVTSFQGAPVTAANVTVTN